MFSFFLFNEKHLYGEKKRLGLSTLRSADISSKQNAAISYN